MNIILFDEDRRIEFLPLTYTRPTAALRAGYYSIADKWKLNNFNVSFLAVDYLSLKYQARYSDLNIYVNSRYLPSIELIDLMKSLDNKSCLINENEVIAIKTEKQLECGSILNEAKSIANVSCSLKPDINKLTDLFARLGHYISFDKHLMSKDFTHDFPEYVLLMGPKAEVFIHPTAKIRPCTLNTEEGPIIIGPNAEVMEGSMIRGPFVLNEGSQTKMGTKIYGPTAIGPFSKVGGEVSNSFIQGYSNKGHDGFLGNSILGEWCNLGADTNSSNLKNNYSDVKVWSYKTRNLESTGLIFCGLIMGDHSKCSINTMFNTGTLVGVHSNIFGSGFPGKFIPSYTWGSIDDHEVYDIEKAVEVARKVYARRSLDFDQIEENILRHIYRETAAFRKV